MNEQVEPYAPRTGSLPWRVIKHLQGLPGGTELSRSAIGRIFTVDNTGSLDTLLQLACARSVLARGRNGSGEVTWKLGGGQCVLAASRPIEETPAAHMAPSWLAPTVPTPDETEPAAAAPASATVASPEIAEFSNPSISTPAGSLSVIVSVDGGGQSDLNVVSLPPAAPKKRRGPSKPRPAAKPYLAEIEPRPLADPVTAETARYHAWLTGFGLHHSAVFRLAQMKQVEAAVGSFTANTKARFRIAKVSQYRAGIERTA